MAESIEKVIYINLRRRTDRKVQIETELLKVFPYEKIVRFNAITNAKGGIGCSMSHIGALELAIQNKWKNVLIVEDDMQWNNFDKGMSKLTGLIDIDYNVIILGGTVVKYYSDTHKLISCQSRTAYLVKDTYYQPLLDNYKEGLTYLLKEYSPQYRGDQYWKRIQNDKWYVIVDPLCIQRPDFSDIERTNVDYMKYFQEIQAYDTTTNKIKSRISMIVTLKNRTNFKVIENGKEITLKLFENNIKSLLELITDSDIWELVIVDFCSTDVNIEEWVNSLHIPDNFTVKLVTIDEPFNRGKGINKGVAVSKYNYILTLDADIQILTRQFFDDIQKYVVAEEKVMFPICWSYSNPEHTEGWKRTTGKGINCMSKKMFIPMKEFNRWGKEDDINFGHFEKLGKTVRPFYGEEYVHQWHPNDLEFKNLHYSKQSTSTLINLSNNPLLSRLLSPNLTKKIEQQSDNSHSAIVKKKIPNSPARFRIR